MWYFLISSDGNIASKVTQGYVIGQTDCLCDKNHMGCSRIAVSIVLDKIDFVSAGYALNHNLTTLSRIYIAYD